MIFTGSYDVLLVVATLAGGASAFANAPSKVTVPKLDLSPLESQIICLKGEIALAILNKVNYQSSAYSFCSSFISIPPVTTSVTITATSLTPTTTTVPVTATVTETLPEATVTTTITAGGAVKRGYPVHTPDVPLKSAIKSIKSEIISAGCSCIRTKIPLATTTSTITATIIQASPTITAFSTITETTTTQATTITTITLPGAPDTNCNGAVCGAFRSCSNTVGGCSCYTAAEGAGFCAQDASCSGPPRCTKSSDCGASQICAVNTCCGAQGICLDLTCTNPARVLIKHRRQAEGGKTSRNDGSNTIGGIAA